MPIKPKYSDVSTGDYLLGIFGGERAARANIAGRAARADFDTQERRGRVLDRADERDALEAERAREKHQLEIERVKRQQAEEESAKLRADQEAAAAREANRWGFERVKRETEAQQRAATGQPRLDPQTKRLFDEAEKLLPRLSEAARAQLLGELEELSTQSLLEAGKKAGVDQAADAIRVLGSSEIDTSPFVAEIQGAAEMLQMAETPAAVAQAKAALNAAVVKSKQAVASALVKEDAKLATIQTITNELGKFPGKEELVSILSRGVQLEQMTTKEALGIALDEVRKTYGLKPLTAAEYAARGGTTQSLYTTPTGRMAYSHIFGEVKAESIKELDQVLGPDATPEQRQAAFNDILERNWELGKARYGFFGPEPSQNEQMPSGALPVDQPMPQRPNLTPHPTDGATPPKVPLEQVREAMGTKPAEAPKDSPEQTKAAIAAEITKRAKERGWSKEKARAEYEKAIKDMGLD